MNNKLKILVVDDEPGLLLTISAVLETKGYEVCTAKNGREAIKKANEIDFDILITDIVMPEMNGVDTAIEMRRIHPDTGIIIMTGYGQEHPLVSQTINEQLGKLLSKPFDFDELFQAISDHKSTSRKSTPD